MPPSVYGRTVPVGADVSTASRVKIVHGPTQDPDLPIVIDLGGWPGTAAWDNRPDATGRMSLLATGYTVVTCWPGANWGHPTSAAAASSGPAGTGLAAIDTAISVAAAAGLNADTVHLYGTSMGGLNCLAWAKDNASTVGGIYLLAPVTDLLHIYDISGTAMPPYGTAADYAPNIRAAWSTADRAATVTATAGMDPARNLDDPGLLDVGSRTAIYAARDDEIVGAASVQAFATATGADLTWSSDEGEAGGGHVFLTALDPWDELAAYRLFSEHNP